MAGPVVSVVGGGVGPLIVTAVIAWRIPELRRLTRLVEGPGDALHSSAEETSDE